MDKENGTKYDDGKPRVDLVPGELIRAAGRAFGYGADKYEDHNWRGGIKHSRLYASLLRHLTAYWDGQTLDEESGLSHLDHAVANLAMMIASPKYDDRYPRHNENTIV